MELDPGASVSEIRKQYRKLSLLWHPDKVEEAEKNTSEAHFIDISKAYKVLTDEDARKNWEEFGHPDGKQSLSLGIALPSWLVSEGSSSVVLLIYGLIFAQLDLITIAMEFRFKVLLFDPKSPDPAEVKLEKLIKEAMEEKGGGDKYEKPKRYTQQIPWSGRVSLLLYSHLLRVPVDNSFMEEERTFVVEKCAKLMNGLLQIALARFHATTIFTIIEVGQFIYQGLYFKEHPLLQLPGIKKEHIRHFAAKKVQNMKDLLSLDDEKRNTLMRFLSDPERDLAISVARQYPLIVIDQADFAVLGDPAITPGSIVTLTIVLRRVNTMETTETGTLAESILPNKDTPVEEMAPRAWWKPEQVGPVAHTPLFPKEVPEKWWIFLCDLRVNKFVCPPGRVNDLNTHKTIRFQFQAPPKEGKLSLHLFVKSESCLACDINAHEVKLVVEPPSAIPNEQEEDDISDPDEDTIAGQLAAARSMSSGQAPAAKSQPKSNGNNANNKKEAVQDDDSSDSDSD
ncbi:hypothetical protein SmJEL517_g05707 [Synchytrium microbalum]|uniref:J domain-containing protein n=1 Tax=Synchytrium microbalum TaxID=1806994 RepID=A0A507BJN7_9FUNG|nr:uncharacterized protein SmJEL517_g05707 [Synchytrium microbalum]TPX30790.1 hypothetical protein SmJEL517_g05707 [Synchytrium microbalum]